MEVKNIPLYLNCNSFLARGDFCHLLITFASILDPEQDRQNVGSDLDSNCLTLLIVFLKEFFEKLIFKSQQMTAKACSVQFFFFFFRETQFHSVIIQTQALVTNYYHYIIFLLPFNGNSTTVMAGWPRTLENRENGQKKFPAGKNQGI